MNTADLLNKLSDYRKSQSETNRSLTAIAKQGLRENTREWDPEGKRPEFLKMDKTVEKLWQCGSWLHFREWIEEGETTLRNANFCKRHVLCRSCAARRAAKAVTAYHAKVSQVMRETSGLIPAMVTRTVKNGHDLHERLAHIKKSHTKLLARKRKAISGKRRHSPIEWNKVQGSIRSLEVTRGKDGTWHPHFHDFVLLDDYIDQKKLSKEWHEITGDSFIVGVTKCKNGILPGLIETLKYSTKASELPPAELWFLYQTLNGSRLIDPQGLLRGVQVGDIDQDDDSALDGPFRDFVAFWSQQKAFYAVYRADERGLRIEGEDGEPVQVDPRELLMDPRSELSPGMQW